LHDKIQNGCPVAAPAFRPDPVAHRSQRNAPPRRRWFSLSRALSYSRRETLELRHDPLRATMALLGSIMLMCIMGYGISLDVENLKYAVLDHDQTGLSQNYALNLSGSRYFTERPPITDYAELDQRMRSGELALAIEIPPNFARDVERGHPVRSPRGWTARCRNAPKRCKVMCKACTRAGCWTWRRTDSARKSLSPPRWRRAIATIPTS
jgi:hypothetical protein